MVSNSTSSSFEEPRLRVLARKVWRKIALRNLTSADNHKQLDRLYAMEDPWQMESPKEQSRFELTNVLLEAKVGRVGTLLELGCGEGHQSLRLATICEQLYGLDVSPRAVERARKRLPTAHFDVGTLPVVPRRPPSGRFDVVVACEVLYYISDIAATVKAMDDLGDACLVTFFGPSAKIVAKHVDSIPGVELGWFFHAPYVYLWAFWRPKR